MMTFYYAYLIVFNVMLVTGMVLVCVSSWHTLREDYSKSWVSIRKFSGFLMIINGILCLLYPILFALVHNVYVGSGFAVTILVASLSLFAIGVLVGGVDEFFE